jgi:zinc protease
MHKKDFDPYDFSKKEIDGVPVYYKNLPWAPCMNIYVVFNTGAFSDPVGKEGLSHFLEHMIFDGSLKIKDKKAVKEWSKKYALNSWNAWTSFYQTAYHLRCLPENYKFVLVGMKDMIFHPYLRKKDIEHERGVITQEAWRRFKNEKYLSYTKEVSYNSYYGHNFSRVVVPLGWPETIAKISQNDVKKWHTEKYAKGNFCIVITGAVEEINIELLNNFIKNIPKKSAKKYEKGLVQIPKKLKIVKNSEEIGDPNEQVDITISRASAYTSQEKTQMTYLFRTLMSDLLNERLRTEKGLCYGVSVYTHLDVDFSEMCMNIKTDEKNIDLVQKEFWKIIKEIIAGKHKNKFNVLKRVSVDQVKSRELMSDDVASNAVNDIIMYDNIVIPLFQDLKEMEEVTYKDMEKFAKETFNPEWTYTEIILPSKK